MRPIILGAGQTGCARRRSFLLEDQQSHADHAIVYFARLKAAEAERSTTKPLMATGTIIAPSRCRYKQFNSARAFDCSQWYHRLWLRDRRD
jgi:hypothetical protein